MKRIMLDNYFFDNPTKENLRKLIDELELCQREGLISYSDKEYIIASRLRYYKENVDPSQR